MHTSRWGRLSIRPVDPPCSAVSLPPNPAWILHTRYTSGYVLQGLLRLHISTQWLRNRCACLLFDVADMTAFVVQYHLCLQDFNLLYDYVSNFYNTIYIYGWAGKMMQSPAVSWMYVCWSRHMASAKANLWRFRSDRNGRPCYLLFAICYLLLIAAI